MFSNMETCALAMALSMLLHYLIPDVEPRKPPPYVEKDAVCVHHESLLSGTIVTTIFVVFQICDLSDSLSVLTAGILISFPMHCCGAVISLIWRVVGVVLTRLYVPVVQLTIYDFSDHMILMMLLIGLGLAPSARLHMMGKVGAGMGSASITAIGIIFGQNLHPYQDLVFNDLYRITSVTISPVMTLALVLLMHRLLSYFTATHFVVSE